jgi:hypothetical protein
LLNCFNSTLCREVVLSNDFNEPLNIEAKDTTAAANVILKAGGKEILVHQITAVPKDKFNTNYIKMAPYCTVKNKKCHALDYQRFVYQKIELETDTNSIRQDPSRTNSNFDYIQRDKVVYLHNYFVSARF